MELLFGLELYETDVLEAVDFGTVSSLVPLSGCQKKHREGGAPSTSHISTNGTGSFWIIARYFHVLFKTMVEIKFKLDFLVLCSVAAD